MQDESMHQRTLHNICCWVFNDYLAYTDERVWSTVEKKCSYSLSTPKKLQQGLMTERWHSPSLVRTYRFDWHFLFIYFAYISEKIESSKMSLLKRNFKEREASVSLRSDFRTDGCEM